MFKILSKITGWLTDFFNPKLSDISAKRAKTLAKTLGSPIFNLTIKIVNHTKEFKDGPFFSADKLIEMWGVAIHNARLLEGDWQVTTQGYLTRFHNEKKGLPLYEAVVIVDDDCGSLGCLDKLWRRELKDGDDRPHVHIHYGDHVSYVRFDKKGAYLDNIKKDWELDQAFEDMKLRSEQWLKRQERMTRKAKVAATA